MSVPVWPLGLQMPLISLAKSRSVAVAPGERPPEKRHSPADQVTAALKDSPSLAKEELQQPFLPLLLSVLGLNLNPKLWPSNQCQVTECEPN